MTAQKIKQQIVEIIKVLRTYGHWMLEDLIKEDLLWQPENTNARTIQSFFRHIINAEIFWLKHLEDETYSYEPKSSDFQKLLLTFDELEKHFITCIQNSKDSDLEFHTPKYEGEELMTPGTLSWVILRTSLHAVHHFGQIAHIRYSMDKPPNKETRKISWGGTMDIIVKAMLL
ncbi:hypothetical protein CEE45_10720 [Candidatus Heimdallarchaeota archaeon B3_Heim]|nr:MAG: hypothetical protein CEE45_10720 [Candidatus Heimdallarchaeota archaeon B3_Heim]